MYFLIVDHLSFDVLEDPEPEMDPLELGIQNIIIIIDSEHAYLVTRFFGAGAEQSYLERNQGCFHYGKLLSSPPVLNDTHHPLCHRTHLNTRIRHWDSFDTTIVNSITDISIDRCCTEIQ